MQDENDRLRAGELDADPKRGAKPLNKAAEAKAANEMRVLSVRDLLRTSMEEAFSQSPPPRCETGHSGIDRLTGAMRNGHTWLLIAETSWGKSSYGITLADLNLKQGKGVLIVSTEDSESIYGNRLMARRAMVSARRLRDHTLKPDELDAVADAANEAEDLPVYLDARGKNIEVIIPQVAELIEREGIQLVIFDYLQEMRAAKRYQDERTKFKDIASQCRCVIKDHDITGIIMSQLTPKDGKRPDKYSVKESKDVADGAEVILVGFYLQEDAFIKSTNTTIPKGEKVIRIDKAKDGEKGLAWMNWGEHSATFLQVKQGDTQDNWRDPADRGAARAADEYGEFDHQGDNYHA